MPVRDEKDLESPVSPISPNAPTATNYDKPLPELKDLESHHPPNPQTFPTAVPARKPVPVAKGAAFLYGDATKTPQVSVRELPQSLDWRQFSRRKRIVVAGAVAAVILFALIIGLSVGLTRRNGYARDLFLYSIASSFVYKG